MSEMRDYTPLELRFVTDAPEFRMADDASSGHITGYAASFGKLSRRLGGFHELISKEAFNESRANGWPNVVCRYNHKPEFLLGTTQAGTCVLSTDKRGLHYDANPPKSRADVLELVQRGDVRYSSFAFRVVPDGGDEWTEDRENGYPLRILHSVELIDVAPVLDPAYFDTTVTTRNMDGIVDSLARHMTADPEEVRSMLADGSIKRFFKRTDIPKISSEAAESRKSAETPAKSTDDTEEDLVEDTCANIDEVEGDAGVPADTDTPDTDTDEEGRKALDAKARNALPDSAFAYIDEDGGRHFPIHDKEHVQKALQLGPRSPMWSKAKAKVLAAAKKHGVSHEEQNSYFLEALEERAAKADYKDLDTCGDCGAENQFGRHCAQCGSAMREQPSSDKFCQQCGSKLKQRVNADPSGDAARSHEHDEDEETRDAGEAAGEIREILTADVHARNADADARLAELRFLLSE